MTSNDLYICVKCKKKYSKYSSWYSHCKTHCAKTVFTCKYCEIFSTDTRAKLYLHAYTCREETKTPITPPPASALPTPFFLQPEKNVLKEENNKLSWQAF